MKYTQIPNDTFERLQLNAGIICTDFTPATGTVSGLMGATTGGFTFKTNPTYKDWGADVDNCPNNTMELKQLESVDPVLSGTFLTMDTATAKSLAAAADIDATDTTKIVPRADLEDADFDNVWWVGDYSDVNEDGTGVSAGFIAICVKRALNQGGFSIKSTKNEKGQMAFEYHGHYTITDMTDVPYEIYVKQGA